MAERNTAPKWAQVIGLTSRRQAVEYMARQQGFKNYDQKLAYFKTQVKTNNSAKASWFQAEKYVRERRPKEFVLRAMGHVSRANHDTAPPWPNLSPSVRMYFEGFGDMANDEIDEDDSEE